MHARDEFASPFTLTVSVTLKLLRDVQREEEIEGVEGRTLEARGRRAQGRTAEPPSRRVSALRRGSRILQRSCHT